MDRHVKKELKKQIRGIRAIERHAEQAPRQEAEVVADDGRAVRTVMRDDGQYPLEPPGVQRYQPLQMIAAPGERVMAVQPSALLKKLSRLLSVVNRGQQEFEQRVRLLRWIHHLAHLLAADTTGEDAQAQLLAFV
jgi:hypothetical protein